MARPYAVDRRERVVRAVAGGASRRAAAAKFAVSISFVVKLMQRWHQRGTIQPDLTIAELRHRLADEGIATSRSGVGRLLIAAGLTRKNRPSTPPSRTARTAPRPGPPGAPSSRR